MPWNPKKSVQKAVKNTIATAKDPLAAARNPYVQRDLATAAAMAAGGGVLGGVAARALMSPKSGGSGGGGGMGTGDLGPMGLGFFGRRREEAEKERRKALEIKDNSSAWLKLQQDQQRVNEQQLIDDASKQSGSSAAEAQSALAMRGGLSSGARERLAASASSDNLMARQGLTRQGDLARMGLATEAEKMRADTEKYNAGVRMGLEGMDRDDFRYKQEEEAKRAAANATADAMRAAAQRKSGLEKVGSDTSKAWKRFTPWEDG